MEFKYITDITHLISEDHDAEMPDELFTFREYLGHFIKAASVTSEVEFQSAVPCRKKINRKPCPGFIDIVKRDIPESFIYWHCSSCEDGGRIAKWRGCPFDQAQVSLNALPGEEPNPRVEVSISREEMHALIHGTGFDPDSERIIYLARPSGKVVRLSGLYDDMENFEGFLASEANHEENKKRQKVLDAVHGRVDGAIREAYDLHEIGAD